MRWHLGPLSGGFGLVTFFFWLMLGMAAISVMLVIALIERYRPPNYR